MRRDVGRARGASSGDLGPAAGQRTGPRLAGGEGPLDGQPRAGSRRDVDGLLGHPAQRGQLAAGHDDDAVRVRADIVLARGLGGGVGVAGQKRAQAGVGRHDVVGAEARATGRRGAPPRADRRRRRPGRGSRRRFAVPVRATRPARSRCRSFPRWCARRPAARSRGGCPAACGARARGRRAGRGRRRTPGARPASGAGGGTPARNPSVKGPVALTTRRALDLEARAGLAVDDRSAAHAAAAIARDPFDARGGWRRRRPQSRRRARSPAPGARRRSGSRRRPARLGGRRCAGAGPSA